MNKVILTATDTFYSTKHGLVSAGQAIEVDEVEAQELLKMTSVKEGGKMDQAPLNKMATWPPANKVDPVDPVDPVRSADAPKAAKRRAVQDTKLAPTSAEVPSPQVPGTADRKE